jgi:ATP-dependent DNA helicase RecQ
MMFYTRGDFTKPRYMIENSTYRSDRTGELNDALNLVMTYCNTTGCRRKFLLEYFGEVVSYTNCGNCDNCSTVQTSRDFSFEAGLLLEAVMQTGQRYGAGMPIDVLRGSKNSKLTGKKFDKLPTYGKGHHLSEKWWKAFASLLQVNGFLVDAMANKYKITKLGPKGSTFLSERNGTKKTVSCHFEVTKELAEVEKATKSVDGTGM